jgi:hypothetical protein
MMRRSDFSLNFGESVNREDSTVSLWAAQTWQKP